MFKTVPRFLKLKVIWTSSVLLLIVPFFALAQPSPKDSAQSSLAKANEWYDSGDCAKAYKSYRSLLKTRGTLVGEDRDRALFRMSYCAYNIGDFEIATKGFSTLLHKYPDFDEARLKYSQSLFALERLDESADHALKVKDPEFKSEARVLAARAYIEQQDGENALAALDEVTADGTEWGPVIEFWRGVAYFQAFDEDAAEKAFRKSNRLSPKEYWTKTSSEDWLKTISESRAWVHVRLGGTWGWDSNIGQMTYRDSSTSSPSSKYYVGESYTTQDIYLYTRPFRSGKIAVSPSLAASAQKYAKSDAYDSESLNVDVTTTYQASPDTTYRGSVSYTNSKYNWKQYGNFWGLTFGGVYRLSKHTATVGSLSATNAAGTSPGMTYTATAGLQGDQPWFYWITGLSYSLATAEKATYKTSGSEVVTDKGVQFGNYNSQSLRLGIGRELPWLMDLFFQYSLARTSYEKENSPASVTYNSAAREDTTTNYQLNLTKVIIEKQLSLTLSYILTQVSSKGFQGVAYSNGAVPDYNVDRTRIFGYLTLGF